MDVITITNDRKQLEVNNAMLIDSKVHMACINGMVFTDISATQVKIADANLSDLEIDGAQLGGAYIHNIGMPPEGHPFYKAGAKQRPLKFEKCDLNGSTLSNCDLSNVEISDSNMAGLKINGVLVTELLSKYNL